MRWRRSGTFDGLYFSITCAEDVPRVAADAGTAPSRRFSATTACANSGGVRRMAKGAAPADAATARDRRGAALIVSGMLDPGDTA